MERSKKVSDIEEPYITIELKDLIRRKHLKEKVTQVSSYLWLSNEQFWELFKRETKESK